MLDEYTGSPRATKTLSGGESFMASLALALGLADVVTAETGGRADRHASSFDASATPPASA